MQYTEQGRFDRQWGELRNIGKILNDKSPTDRWFDNFGRNYLTEGHPFINFALILDNLDLVKDALQKDKQTIRYELEIFSHQLSAISEKFNSMSAEIRGIYS
jgi:hypothetical protein